MKLSTFKNGLEPLPLTDVGCDSGTSALGQKQTLKTDRSWEDAALPRPA
jgi:hypothetical protein